MKIPFQIQLKNLGYECLINCLILVIPVSCEGLNISVWVGHNEQVPVKQVCQPSLLIISLHQLLVVDFGMKYRSGSVIFGLYIQFQLTGKNLYTSLYSVGKNTWTIPHPAVKNTCTIPHPAVKKTCTIPHLTVKNT